MGYGFPQFSVVFSCIIMILLTTALNTIQNSLLIFGKYRAHIWVVDFEKNKNKFQNFKDNYWNYYFSITILSTIIKISSLLLTIHIINSYLLLITNKTLFFYLRQKYILHVCSAIFAFLIMLIIVNSYNSIEIHSDKRIQPEKRLTTDGKTVDTLFIYKQER